VPPYDSNIIYKPGNIVTNNGKMWIVKDATGQAGYPPPLNGSSFNNTWTIVGTDEVPSYNNDKIYKVGDIVTNNGKVWMVKDATGQAGYTPPLSGSTNNTWIIVSAVDGTTYTSKWAKAIVSGGGRTKTKRRRNNRKSTRKY
jgi:hypothetical protein